MPLRSRLLVATLALALGACASAPVPSDASPPAPADGYGLAFGRTYTGWLYAGETARLWERLSPEMRDVFGTPEGLTSFGNQVRAEAGAERAVLREQTLPWLQSEVYNRTAEFERGSGPLWVQWTVDKTGLVLGLLVTPAPVPAASASEERQTRTPLRLPFQGDWFVTWGGRSVFENYHAVAPDQRFATDFLVVRDGQTHTGDPSQNESYFCFGLPVLAPGDGVVVDAADGVADNAPGQLNGEQPLGNHVVIDHGSGEFSFLVHLQRGSVAVGPRQRVEAGQRLGTCGNSGHSSEPHLHYHLQDTAEYQRGNGLPAQFLGYRADGAPVDRGEPTRGQVVSQR